MLGHHFRAIDQAPPKRSRLLLGMTLSALAASMVALEHGFIEAILPPPLMGFLQIGLTWVALCVWGDIAWRNLNRRRWRSLFAVLAESAVVLAAVAEASGVPGAGETIALGIVVAMMIRLNGVLARSMRNPSLLFPVSFLLLITVSASLLKLPASTPPSQPITWVDAFFTATSAVCVTGLAVRDTAAGFTHFGQAVIMGSIQLGGLGVMIFGSTLALLFGARLSHREHLTLSMALDEYPVHRITRFAWFIVLATFMFEGAGATILYFTWPPAMNLHGDARLWSSIFHSVSAFCNAGFDITDASMIPVRAALPPYLGIIPMIITGGLGFIVLEDVYRQARDRLRGRIKRIRLSTHSRIVLVTTACLLLGGTAVITLAQSTAENGFTIQHALDALFMSTSARTAGFTTMPMEELTSGSRFMLMVLMFIGGSPGSTAGGVKTVVFAVLVLSIVSTVRGRDEVEVFGRALPDAIVKKAATVAAGLLGVISGATLILDLTEHFRFEPLIFEVISAATTTGLSLGITADLSPVGRVIITITMFLGRVGALALLASLIGFTASSARYRLPRDTVSLG